MVKVNPETMRAKISLKITVIAKIFRCSRDVFSPQKIRGFFGARNPT
jgi:hypothetical protein